MRLPNKHSVTEIKDIAKKIQAYHPTHVRPTEMGGRAMVQSESSRLWCKDAP